MNTTFIIPIRVESPDRRRNVKACIRYLLKNTESKIIIKEVDERSLIPEFLSEEIKNPRVRYIFEHGVGPFHRTRYLNDMLQLVDTPLVSNYDADVILHPESYKLAEQTILSNTADVIYPYPESDTGQIKLKLSPLVEEKFLRESTLESLDGCQHMFWRAQAGFCFMIRTSDYISSGAEVEQFISYGPEDVERIERFAKMGLNILRIDSPVFHMEHSRSPDSDNRNPHVERNWRVYETMRSMKGDAIAEYLNKLEYMTSRSWLASLKHNSDAFLTKFVGI